MRRTRFHDTLTFTSTAGTLGTLGLLLHVGGALLLAGTSPVAAQRLGGGTFVVESGNVNQNVVVRGAIPAAIGATVGRDLVISLRDATRPERVCPDDEFGGLDQGCLVVDWPVQAPSGPVPLPNRVTLDTLDDSAGGEVTLHLRRSLTLEAQPEPPFG